MSFSHHIESVVLGGGNSLPHVRELNSRGQFSTRDLRERAKLFHFGRDDTILGGGG